MKKGGKEKKIIFMDKRNEILKMHSNTHTFVQQRISQCNIDFQQKYLSEHTLRCHFRDFHSHRQDFRFDNNLVSLQFSATIYIFTFQKSNLGKSPSYKHGLFPKLHFFKLDSAPEKEQLLWLKKTSRQQKLCSTSTSLIKVPSFGPDIQRCSWTSFGLSQSRYTNAIYFKYLIPSLFPGIFRV